MHVQTIEGNEVRLAVLFLALEAIDGHSTPIRIDDHAIRMHLPTDKLLAVVIDHIGSYRRCNGQYQCKEEHYY